eukprot:CAMPEP_0173459832 /NCGR_PEP_ID=MMETSP1357-20121228/62109_1 /TAXON_ID=77926 /ORGANISM="Hemiselmis rufescens, Strain PCC563" /LENGTH=92 /DNA_ID=CAMNT_0014427329 /DNA_START=1 /DNA_END=276 /DNA_ORIENTATION=+
MKRYSQFEQLHKTLSRHVPEGRTNACGRYVGLPALPAKRLVFSMESLFLEQRQQALGALLHCIMEQVTDYLQGHYTLPTGGEGAWQGVLVSN